MRVEGIIFVYASGLVALCLHCETTDVEYRNGSCIYGKSLLCVNCATTALLYATMGGS